jgi:curved DNA-binding protein CbpA
MAASEDHYRVLQVVPEADHEVIRAAYRALARKYHPDLPTGSRERMIALNAAWSVLQHPRTRSVYDAARAGSGDGPTNGSRPAQSSRSGTAAKGAPAAGSAAPAAESGRPSGTIPPPTGKRPTDSTFLDYGRYEGWSIVELAKYDPNYLEWLVRTTNGRRYQREVEAALAKYAPQSSAPPEPPTKSRKRGRF